MKRIYTISALPEALQDALQGLLPRSSLTCPACAGGRSGEASLSAFPTDAGLVGLKCHRNSCGYFALVGGTDFDFTQRKVEARVYRGDLAELSTASKYHLESRYELREKTLITFGVKEVAICRYYLPVLGPEGTRGGLLRATDGSEPKATSYKQTARPWQAWYIQTEPRGHVIIEDQFSAMRAWQLGYTAVALLGTSLNSDKREELLAWRREWMLALDADAYSKALGYARKWPQFRPIRLEADLKDISDTQIEERLA